MLDVQIGYDSRFDLAYKVCERSLRNTRLPSSAYNRSDTPLFINPIKLQELREKGLYYRPTSTVDGGLWDDISGAPMSTEFAISRFLAPYRAGFDGWSLFCDSDFLFRTDVIKLFQQADSQYAVMCVKHKYQPVEKVKMDGRAQSNYHRKNWSSLMLFNNEHPMNKFLTVENVNSLAGRDLHRFCWLLDSQIGALDESWNWLEGHSSPEIIPDAVHFTRGTPDLAGYENVPYADEWRAYANR